MQRVQYGSTWTLVSKTSQLTHRLVVLDILSPEAREYLPEAPAAIIADPPYSSGGAHSGLRKGSTVRKYAQGPNIARYLDWAGDNRDQRSWTAWSTRWLSLCHQIAVPETYAFIFSDWRQLPSLTDAFQAAGWVWRGVNVWNKGNARASHHGYFRPQAEFVGWGTAGKLKPRYDLGKIAPGVFTQSGEGRKKVHLCQKPVTVLEWLLEPVASDGPVVDPFAGSGSSILAADRAGRPCVAFEVVPNIAEQALDRVAAEGFEVREDGRWPGR